MVTIQGLVHEDSARESALAPSAPGEIDQNSLASSRESHDPKASSNRNTVVLTLRAPTASKTLARFVEFQTIWLVTRWFCYPPPRMVEALRELSLLMVHHFVTIDRLVRPGGVSSIF